MKRAVRGMAGVVAIAAGWLAAPGVAPVGAHSGGRAQLYVESVRLEPQPGGWGIALVLRDADSGRPEPGFGVQVTASAPGGRAVGPVNLADPDSDGRYAAVMPLSDGAWQLTVEAGEIPGGAQAVPFTKSWPVTLRAGQALDLGGSRPPAVDRHEADGRRFTVPLGIGVAVALVVVARARKPKVGGAREGA